MPIAALVSRLGAPRKGRDGPARPPSACCAPQNQPLSRGFRNSALRRPVSFMRHRLHNEPVSQRPFYPGRGKSGSGSGKVAHCRWVNSVGLCRRSNSGACPADSRAGRMKPLIFLSFARSILNKRNPSLKNRRQYFPYVNCALRPNVKRHLFPRTSCATGFHGRRLMFFQPVLAHKSQKKERQAEMENDPRESYAQHKSIT